MSNIESTIVAQELRTKKMNELEKEKAILFLKEKKKKKALDVENEEKSV